jgi:hypothetical protein
MSTESIFPSEWLDHLLNFDGSLDYIKSGGSLIRFATVDDDETHSSLWDCIDTVRIENGLWVFSAEDNPDFPLYRPNKVVESLANNLPMSIGEILDNLVQKIWNSIGITDPGIVLIREAASFLGDDQEFLYRRFNSNIRELMGRDLESQNVEGSTGRNWSFTRDFSNAVINSCTDIIEGKTDSIRVIENWLQNIPSSSRDRRKIGIMSPLKRDNATGILRSLISLCTMSDSSPCIFHIDIRGVTDPSLFTDCDRTRNYTRTERIATYQWIRELIDQTSMFKNTLIILETGPSFTDISPNGKGVGMYDALKNRIIDDVLVNGVVNSSAVLVLLNEKAKD